MLLFIEIHLCNRPPYLIKFGGKPMPLTTNMPLKYSILTAVSFSKGVKYPNKILLFVGVVSKSLV